MDSEHASLYTDRESVCLSIIHSRLTDKNATFSMYVEEDLQRERNPALPDRSHPHRPLLDFIRSIAFRVGSPRRMEVQLIKGGKIESILLAH